MQMTHKIDFLEKRLKFSSEWCKQTLDSIAKADKEKEQALEEELIKNKKWSKALLTTKEEQCEQKVKEVIGNVDG